MLTISSRSISRPLALRSGIVLGLALLVAGQACADVVGRLKITVKNAADEKPLPGATITLTDSANVRPPLELKTAADGTITTSPLEARAFTLQVKADEYQIEKRTVTVIADTTTSVEVLLEPAKEKVIRITGNRNVTRPTETTTAVKRDQTFNRKYPNTANNRQSLGQFLRSVPGFAQDSVGQVHPRGEHASTTVYLNGFQLPGAFQGRSGQILGATAIQDVDVLTGAYAPEYGRETAAVLNISLRAGTITPAGAYSVTGGGYRTFEGGVTYGGQLGQEYGAPDDAGRRARRLGYLFDFDSRTTENALEPPQPGDQTAHNSGRTTTTFGNLEYRLDGSSSLGLIFAANPADTEVANRTGLSGYPGGGYGFGGNTNAASGLPNQNQAGQDVYSRDRNEFGVLNYRRDLNPSTQLLASVGVVHTGIDILNHSPAVPGTLPNDSSLEYNPTIIRNGRDAQFQASLSHTIGTHTIKVGALIDRQTGLESYRVESQSQLALDSLAATVPGLAPTGTFDPNNLDENGNPIFTATGDTPTVRVDRRGYYRAAYAQDTWRITPKFTANYGLRFDNYESDQTTFDGNGGVQDGRVSLQTLSPRVNLAYAVAPGTVVRASYNRLFIAPPTAQGANVGEIIRPETLDQYEVGVEHQTGPGQSLRVTTYYKEIKDQLDTGLLIPGTQIGAFVTENLPEGFVRGVEMAYNLVPVRPSGVSAYASYAYAIAKPQGVEDAYNDHDQLNTISTGAAYTFENGVSLGGTFNFGSGFYSSTVTQDRTPHRSFNVRASTGDRLIGHGVTATLDVENLFDQRDLLNFNSAFSGTRFQQGRRVLLTLGGRF